MRGSRQVPVEAAELFPGAFVFGMRRVPAVEGAVIVGMGFAGVEQQLPGDGFVEHPRAYRRMTIVGAHRGSP